MYAFLKNYFFGKACLSIIGYFEKEQWVTTNWLQGMKHLLFLLRQKQHCINTLKNELTTNRTCFKTFGLSYH
jgi:hypothetical protein